MSNEKAGLESYRRAESTGREIERVPEVEAKGTHVMVNKAIKLIKTGAKARASGIN